MELQDSRLGFNVCVAPSSVKLGVLEFTEVGGGLMGRSWIDNREFRLKFTSKNVQVNNVN